MKFQFFRRAYPRSIALTIIAIALVYCSLLFLYHGPLNTFFSSDHGVKLFQTQSLIVTKFGSQALVYPGAAIDPEQRYIPFRGQYLIRGSEHYGMFPQIFAAVSTLPFFLFGYAGLYLVPLVSALGILLVFALLGALLLKPATNIAGLIGLGIASPIVFYALNFWEHTPATFFALGAVYCMLRTQIRYQQWLPVCAGLLLAVALAFRNEVVLLAPAMLISLFLFERLRAIRAAAAFSFGLFLGLMPLLLFNHMTYGNFQGPHVAVAGAGMRLGWIAWIDMLIVPLQPITIVLMCIALLAIDMLSEWLTAAGSRLFWLACALIGLVILQCTAPLEELELMALLTSFPWVLLIFLPIPKQHLTQQATIAAYLRNSAFIFIMLCLLLRLPDGGAQHGPRLLLPIMPLLMLAGLWRAEQFFAQPIALRQKATMLIVLTLIAQAGLSAQASGLRNYRYVVSRNHAILSTTAQSGYKIIITDTNYTPLLIAPLMYDGHDIFMIENGKQLDDLLDRLRAQHIDQFYYLGVMPAEITEQSASWALLKPLSQRSSFAHRLLGQGFQIPMR